MEIAHDTERKLLKSIASLAHGSANLPSVRAIFTPPTTVKSDRAEWSIQRDPVET